jgi:hypothetical protein
VAVSGASSDNDLWLTAADALVTGRVIDEAAMAAPGILLQAVPAEGGDGVAFAGSDSSGDYVLGVLSGQDWHISLLDAAAQAVGLIGTRSLDVPAVAGSLALQDDTIVYVVDAWLQGVIHDQDGSPVAGVPVTLSNSDTGTAAVMKSRPDGTYRLGVNSGNCEVRLDPAVTGHDPVLPVSLPLDSGQMFVQDFTLSGSGDRNSIIITEAIFNLRKQTLSVAATSTSADAQLYLDEYGPMDFVKQFKETYIWEFTGDVPFALTDVTVSGPEGSTTENVTLK